MFLRTSTSQPRKSAEPLAKVRAGTGQSLSIQEQVKLYLDNPDQVLDVLFIGTFNTTVDIKLKQWAENQLGLKCVEVGWETLKEQFLGLVERSKKTKDHDDIFDNLKGSVVDEAMHRHMWEDKGAEMLRVIQLNTLEDRAVHDKHQWDSAINFLEASLREKLENSEANLRDQVGPGFYEKWFKWQNVTDEQSRKASVLYELERLLRADDDHKAHLSFEELTTIKVNLKNLLKLLKSIFYLVISRGTCRPTAGSRWTTKLFVKLGILFTGGTFCKRPSSGAMIADGASSCIARASRTT